MLIQCLSKHNGILLIYQVPFEQNDIMHSNLFAIDLSTVSRSFDLSIPLLQTKPSMSAQVLTSE
jgi:hypothetical protein